MCQKLRIYFSMKMQFKGSILIVKLGMFFIDFQFPAKIRYLKKVT